MRSSTAACIGIFLVPATGTGQTVQSTPELTLEVRQPDATVTADIDVEITLTNVGDRDVTIAGAKLIFPAALVRTRDTIPQSLIGCSSGPGDANVLARQSQRYYHCVVDRYDRVWWKQALDLSTLFFLPGKYRIGAVVEYDAASTDTTRPSAYHRRILRQYAEVDLRPPLMTLLRGAWIGCFLAALFLALRYRRGDAGAQPSWNQVKWYLARVLLTGVVSATIIVLLLQRLSDIGLPLTVEVNDWVGGVIVGLVAYTSTETIYKRLAGGDG